MSEHLHTVTITGTEDNPRIEFACAGGRDADCHRWAKCSCEGGWDWDRDEECDHAIPQDDCWLKLWFTNGDTDPSAGTLADADYRVGMSGPITATTCDDVCCVEWEFIEEVRSDGE